MGKKERNIAIGTVLVAGLGYFAGILTAKKPGKETRQDISSAGKLAKNTVEKTIKKLYGDLTDLITEADKVVKDAKSNTKEGLKKSVVAAKKTKESIREVLSAIHEGDATDTDLKKAVNDAKKSITHLRTYVKKQTK